MAKYDRGFLVDLISGSNDDNDSRGKEMFSFCVQTYSLRKREISHSSGEAPLTGELQCIYLLLNQFQTSLTVCL